MSVAIQYAGVAISVSRIAFVATCLNVVGK
jgi:hypothetical protein